MKSVHLAPDVFFRQTPEGDVLLYQTAQSTVSLLGGSILPLLELLRDHSDTEDLYRLLSQTQPIEREEFDSTIAQLAELGIVVPPTVLEERKRTLESAVKLSQYDADHRLCSVQFELTFRCNERCRHCYCPRENEISKELTTAEIKHVIDDLKKMNVVELTFTGGDLFMRSDTFEILEYAYAQGFVINIFTNGTLLSDADFFRLKKLYPRSVHFSIYNYIPEKHDAFTQLPGSFQKTTDAIKKCKLLGIPVNIKVSLLEENYDDVDGILRLAEALGTTIQVSLQITPTNNGSMMPTAHRLNSAERYAEVMKTIDSHILLSCAGGELTLTRKRQDVAICGAGAFSLNINPYGEVYPCNALLISCGNVRQTPIAEIWQTSQTLQTVRSFRIEQVKGCEACADRDLCDYCPGSAMQETGDPLRRYSEACMLTYAKKLKQKGGTVDARHESP
ncbi:MAG: radical SAM protein [Oscillospiraceae bacterium]|nr:radical SAM protein [Oscillospiraceae bacterium]